MNTIKLITYIAVFLIFLCNISMASGNIYKNFKATYNFEFSGMTVAKGTLTGNLHNNNTYSVHFNGQTTPFISIFYSLKEAIECSINTKNAKDIYYKSVEKSHKKEKHIFANFLDNSTVKVTLEKNSTKKYYSLYSREGIFSPLSLYLFFMNNKFEFNKTYYRNIVVTNRIYKVAIKPLKYVTINLDKLKRKYGRCQAIEVEIKFYKIDKNNRTVDNKKVKKIIAWVYRKAPNIPVFIESWHYITSLPENYTYKYI